MSPEADAEMQTADAQATPQEPAVITRVKHWMDLNGVGLEMKVAGAFRKQLPNGRFMSSVQHSRTYTGFDESSGVQKVRETDVVVKLTKLIMNKLLLTTWLIIECKSSKDSTWILHYDSAQQPIFTQVPFGGLWDLKHHQSIAASNIMGNTQTGMLSGNGISSCYAVSATRDSNARGNQKNDARDAIMQVLSASKGVQEEVELEDGFAQLHIFIPVVVTNAPIVNVTLQLNGECKFSEAKRGLFLGNLSSESREQKGAWVVQSSDLEEFVIEILGKIHSLDYMTN